jgi:hypothetical protein
MSDFRLSRVRARDFSEIFALKYPVRCRTCRERRFVFILRALKIRFTSRRSRGENAVEKSIAAE